MGPTLDDVLGTDAATYLTVRVQDGVDAWVHIDNFSLVPDGIVSTDENTWGRIKSIYR